MRKISLALFVNWSLLFLAGCGQAIRVTHAPAKTQPTQLDGIPFYLKVGACKHETVWLEPSFKISLSKSYKLDGKEVTDAIGTRILPLKDYNSDEFRKFILLFEKSKATTSEDEILKAFSQFKNYVSPMAALPAEENRLLASNKNEPTSFVNYGELYYYNVKKPVTGTVSAEADLNTDGTLSKGTASIEDKTLQTFLDLIPVKDVVTAAAKGALGVAALDGGTGPVSLKLTIEPQTYQYTLYTIGALNPLLPCPEPGPALIDGPEKVNFARTLLSGSDTSKRDDAAKKVKFSGSVEVPK